MLPGFRALLEEHINPDKKDSFFAILTKLFDSPEDRPDLDPEFPALLMSIALSLDPSEQETLVSLCIQEIDNYIRQLKSHFDIEKEKRVFTFLLINCLLILPNYTDEQMDEFFKRVSEQLNSTSINSSTIFTTCFSEAKTQLFLFYPWKKHLSENDLGISSDSEAPSSIHSDAPGDSFDMGESSLPDADATPFSIGISAYHRSGDPLANFSDFSSDNPEDGMTFLIIKLIYFSKRFMHDADNDRARQEAKLKQCLEAHKLTTIYSIYLWMVNNASRCKAIDLSLDSIDTSKMLEAIDSYAREGLVGAHTGRLQINLQTIFDNCVRLLKNAQHPLIENENGLEITSYETLLDQAKEPSRELVTAMGSEITTIVNQLEVEHFKTSLDLFIHFFYDGTVDSIFERIIEVIKALSKAHPDDENEIKNQINCSIRIASLNYYSTEALSTLYSFLWTHCYLLKPIKTSSARETLVGEVPEKEDYQKQAGLLYFTYINALQALHNHLHPSYELSLKQVEQSLDDTIFTPSKDEELYLQHLLSGFHDVSLSSPARSPLSSGSRLAAVSQDDIMAPPKKTSRKKRASIAAGIGAGIGAVVTGVFSIVCPPLAPISWILGKMGASLSFAGTAAEKTAEMVSLNAAGGAILSGTASGSIAASFPVKCTNPLDFSASIGEPFPQRTDALTIGAGIGTLSIAALLNKRDIARRGEQPLKLLQWQANSLMLIEKQIQSLASEKEKCRLDRNKRIKDMKITGLTDFFHNIKNITTSADLTVATKLLLANHACMFKNAFWWKHKANRTKRLVTEISQMSREVFAPSLTV